MNHILIKWKVYEFNSTSYSYSSRQWILKNFFQQINTLFWTLPNDLHSIIKGFSLLHFQNELMMFLDSSKWCKYINSILKKWYYVGSLISVSIFTVPDKKNFYFPIITISYEWNNLQHANSIHCRSNHVFSSAFPIHVDGNFIKHSSSVPTNG